MIAMGLNGDLRKSLENGIHAADMLIVAYGADLEASVS